MRSLQVMGLGALTGFIAVGCGQATATPQAVAPSAAPAQPQPGALEQFQKRSNSTIAAYLRVHTVRKVQLGAGGSRLKGWLNTDIEPGDGLAYLDATRPFPFEDASLQYVFSEHVIEHLTYDEGKAMMAEAHRVLAPGGRMRVSTPDLMQFIALFDTNPSEEARAFIEGKRVWHRWPKEGNGAAIVLNLQMSSWGHKFMYDFETLSSALVRAGFQDPRQFEEDISNDPHLRELEGRDSGGVNDRWSNYETMSVEVEKPRTSTTR